MANSKKQMAAEMAHEIADSLGMTFAQMNGEGKAATRARQRAYYEIKTSMDITFREIGEAIGNVKHASVIYGCNAHAKLLGLPKVKTGRPKMTQDEINHILKLRRSGVRPSQIAAQMGRSHAAINARLKEAGMPAYDLTAELEPRRVGILKYLATHKAGGAHVYEIMEFMGINKSQASGDLALLARQGRAGSHKSGLKGKNNTCYVEHYFIKYEITETEKVATPKPKAAAPVKPKKEDSWTYKPRPKKLTTKQIVARHEAKLLRQRQQFTPAIHMSALAHGVSSDG